MVSGDNCSVLESEFGITLAQFISWNPEINSQCTSSLYDCQGLWWLTIFSLLQARILSSEFRYAHDTGYSKSRDTADVRCGSIASLALEDI